MKNLAVLGSSGSIGQSTLEVVRSLPRQFKIVALSVNSDIVKLRQQINEFQPRLVCVRDPRAAAKLSANLGSSIKVLCGPEGLDELVKYKDIQQIMVNYRLSCLDSFN
jgi:1-deoxy-D-xylulose-5-phosphate reductoisomerase